MKPALTRDRVRTLLGGFTGKRILVLGDVMLDEFIWGSVRRISPEAPVPIVEVSGESYTLGGAGNVAANIRALGGIPILAGIIGKDTAADRVRHLMSELGMECSALLTDERPTTVKRRVIAHNQQIVRTDRESREPLTTDRNQAVAAAFTKWLPTVNAVIVSDYDKGVVNSELLSLVLPEAHKAGVPVYLDPRVHHADFYHPITLIKPNQHEAERLVGLAIGNELQLEEAGRKLLEKFNCPYALISRGEAGMSLFQQGHSHYFPTVARDIFDVTGAGDTVLATLAVARAGGAEMEEAVTLANHAAGIVVGKVGTATISQSELLADFISRNADSTS
jgi:D-beta-D-heptose 7-phosphate kinase/D-beta-D-heptose 1-phosphate adenosyltransferase